MLWLSPPPRPTSFSARELDLVTAAQRGDISAFNQLVRAHQEIAYRFAFHVLDDADAAERLTQEAFHLAYQQIRRWQGQSFKIWLLKILAQQCRRAARGGSPGRASNAQSPVEIGLAVLTPDERIICVLGDVLGLSADDIATITNVPLSAVRAARNRARRQIRDVLQIQRLAAQEHTLYLEP